MSGLATIKFGLYRHFKGGKYILEDLAINSETDETMVVYRSTNRKRYVDDGILYVRPYDMFFSKCDPVRYPYLWEEDRFEYIGDNNKIIN